MSFDQTLTTVVIKCKDFIDAMEKAKAQGGNNWYSSVLRWQINKIRKSPKAEWIKVIATVGDAHGFLYLASENEVHFGSIVPSSQSELDIVNRSKSKENQKFSVREMGPCLLIRKYQCNVEVRDDKITPIQTPSKEYESPLFRSIELYQEAFALECKKWLENKILVKNDDDYLSTIEDTSKIHIIKNSRIVSPIQVRISHSGPSNKLNKGKLLPNPLLRVQIQKKILDEEKSSGAKAKGLNAEFLDMSKPFVLNGEMRYQVAKVNGENINDENIHKWILSGCINSLLLDLSSVCLSASGISTPTKAMVIITKPVVQKNKIDQGALCSLFPSQKIIENENENKNENENEKINENENLDENEPSE